MRNAVIKFERKGMIEKNGKGRKMIKLAPALNVQAKGNVFLDYKFVSIEPQEV